MDNRLFQILTANLLLNEQASDALMLMVASSIRAGGVDTKWLTGEHPKPYALAATDAPGEIVYNRYDLSDERLPNNSVAIIPIVGIIYIWDTLYIENYIVEAMANPAIVSVLLWVQSPGGMASRIDILADAIKNAPKPVGAYVTQMCCSAAQWLVSGSKFIMASSPMDMFGSIGVMMSYMNLDGFWEQMGVKKEDIYATKSTLKNNESRQAQNGNYKPIIEELDFLNELFHCTISANLGIPRDSDENTIYQGATFYADEAIRLRLATGRGTFDNAVNKVFELGMITKANNFNFNI